MEISSPSLKWNNKSYVTIQARGEQLSVYFMADSAPVSVLAVCRGGAGAWTRPGARPWTGLLVLSRGRWAGARPGTGLGPGPGLWARLGPGPGPGSGGGSARRSAPSGRLLLRGATQGPGAAPGAVAAPGTTLWAGVAAGARAALAVDVETEKSLKKCFLCVKL